MAKQTLLCFLLAGNLLSLTCDVRDMARETRSKTEMTSWLSRQKRDQSTSMNDFKKPGLTGKDNTIPDEKGEIRIGLLIPYTSKVVMSTYKTGEYYVSSFLIAADKINNDSDLLPGHKLSIVYNDTGCLAEKEIQLFYYQLAKMNVAGIIGLGCAGCKIVAAFAGALNVPIISHVSASVLIFAIFRDVQFSFVYSPPPLVQDSLVIVTKGPTLRFFTKMSTTFKIVTQTKHETLFQGSRAEK